MAKPLGAELVDLCKPAPYPSFDYFSTGANPLAFERFAFNRLLGKLDVFVSVAKLKSHYTAGVTLALKNLIGLALLNEYKREVNHTSRTVLHGSGSFDTHLPGVIVDMNRACPLHLAVIDGGSRWSGEKVCSCALAPELTLS